MFCFSVRKETMWRERWIPTVSTISTANLVGTLTLAPKDTARKSTQSLAWAQSVEKEVNFLKASLSITTSAVDKPIETNTEDALAVLNVAVTIKGWALKIFINAFSWFWFIDFFLYRIPTSGFVELRIAGNGDARLLQARTMERTGVGLDYPSNARLLTVLETSLRPGMER